MPIIQLGGRWVRSKNANSVLCRTYLVDSLGLGLLISGFSGLVNGIFEVCRIKWWQNGSQERNLEANVRGIKPVNTELRNGW